MESDWCQEEDICIDVVGFIPGCCPYAVRYEKFKEIKKTGIQRIRCPKCKKRFMSFIRECHDPGCYHAFFPKHKKPVKKPRKVSRDV